MADTPVCSACGKESQRYRVLGGRLVCPACYPDVDRELKKERRRTGPGVLPGRVFSPEEIAARTEKLRHGYRSWQERRKAIKAGAMVEGMPPTHHAVSNRHWEVVMAWLGGLQPVEIARMIGYSQVNVVLKILKRPDIAALIEKVRQAQLQRVIDGEFGVRAQAKVAAPKAMAKIAQLATDAAKDADKIKAGTTVLQVAGELVEQHRHHHVHQLVSGLSRLELEALAEHGEWPERLRPMVRQLGLERKTLSAD